ncbi:MAG: thioredoxin domain-containing protein [Anaerolineales bacterium]
MPTKTKTAKTTPPPPPVEPVIEPVETVTFKRGHFYSFMVVMALGLGLILGYSLGQRNPNAQTSQTAQAAPAVVQAPAVTPVPLKYNITTAGFPSIGPANAPITIVEFSDYQCPYCTQWHDTTYKPLMAAYPGKIRLVYRNYPLPFHQNAYMAAEAADCAGDQNAYWQYHDALFANNDQLNNQAGTVVDNSFYINLASGLSLDSTAFSTCLTTGKYKQAVQNDLDYANSLPADSNGDVAVGGTPTFFVNGYRIVGAEPLAYFQQIIDAQLQTQ